MQKFSLLLIVFVLVFCICAQLTRQNGIKIHINCSDYCKQHNKIAAWYQAVTGSNQCICVKSETDNDSIINEKELSYVRNNPLVCSNAGASCESCCKNHMGMTDWEKSFTDFRPDLCLCKENPDEIFKPSEQESSFDEETKLKGSGILQIEPNDVEINNKHIDSDNKQILDKFAQPQPCKNAGPSCEFCCRKRSKIVDWNRSFKGNNECICTDKPERKQ